MPATAPPQRYTLSLHDALPISRSSAENQPDCRGSDAGTLCVLLPVAGVQDGRGFGPIPMRCRFLWRLHGCTLLTSMLQAPRARDRSEEHTSELRHTVISYARDCSPPALHSFPTRRSSDLTQLCGESAGLPGLGCRNAMRSSSSRRSSRWTRVWSHPNALPIFVAASRLHSSDQHAPSATGTRQIGRAHV